MIQRTITAVLLLLITLYAVFSGGVTFVAFLATLASLCCWEFLGMVQHRYRNIMSVVMAMLVLAALGFAYETTFYSWWNHPWLMAGVMGVLMLFSFELLVKRVSFGKHPFLAPVRILLLFTLMAVSVFLVREKIGIEALLFACIVIWTTDSMALIGGKSFGKRKLTSISPNKTIEGSVIGMLSAVVAGGLFAYFTHFDLMRAIWMSILISVLAQLGDLHESMTKRHFDVKDSSNLLPGHGGIYDRIDAFLFVFPILYFLF